MQPESQAVLGVDAAWTDGEPSGIALLRQEGTRWRCLRAAPSYDTFCEGFEWGDPISGSPINVRAVLGVIEQLLEGSPLRAIAVDMPMATTAIVARRRADSEVSRRFGHRKCSVHSPLPTRPGETGRRLQQQLTDAGFPLASTLDSRPPALLEVYPHVALLGLTGRSERLPYKVSKVRTYWPGDSREVQKRRLLREWEGILGHLGRHLDGICVPLPEDPDGYSLAGLKRFEDAIDGLVCAWMAVEFLRGSATPLGDETAAIWIPSNAMQFAQEVDAA